MEASFGFTGSTYNMGLPHDYFRAYTENVIDDKTKKDAYRLQEEAGNNLPHAADFFVLQEIDDINRLELQKLRNNGFEIHAPHLEFGFGAPTY